MEEEKSSSYYLMKLAALIVSKRKAIVVLFAIACVYCAASMTKVNVENDLTKYLPDTTETRQGLDLMEEEFTTFGTARILLTNITYEKALQVSKELGEIKGVASVSFYDVDDDMYDELDRPDYYKDSAALLTITFDEKEESALAQEAVAQVRDHLSGYESYVYTTVDKDDAAELRADMRFIAVLVVIIILLVLLFTSQTYMEILIFLIVFGVAAILNVGTNYWLGTISFISNAVGTILQLALAIDYAIILFHRFLEEKQQLGTMEAVITALSKGILEISSSSLTTIAGMVAMMFMQFGIGRDMGLVLMKAILFSMLTVFLLMPALIVMFSKYIDKSVHKSFVPSIRLWGQFVVKTRYIVLPLFVVLSGCAFLCSSKCDYIYDVNSIDSDKKNEYLISRDRIAGTFEVTNTMAVIVPREDYTKEGYLVAELETLDSIDTVIGLSNVEVDEDGEYILVDSLNPREFSEVAEVDLDFVRLLYRIYAVDKKQYSAFIKNLDDYRVPIINMVDFIYQQKESGALDFDDEKSSDIDELYDSMCKAREQLEGKTYSRIIFMMRGPVEGDSTFREIDNIRAITHKYYDETYVAGDATSNYDLSNSFKKDNTVISVLTALFVGVILLFTFQSASLPFLLVLVIQSSIFINFAFPYLTGSSMFFLCYLIVNAIQMGATIDYAIVVTNRYITLRKELPTKEEAVIEALNQAFPTVATSGTIMTCAAFAIGKFTANATISTLGMALGRGTLVSIVMVMTVLPQILMVFDKLIEKTGFSKEVELS